MKKIILSSIIFTLTASPLFAVKEYYSISKSIRSLGMGGAFYGLSNDQYALFYNPAGLGLYKGESQGMLEINSQAGTKTISSINTITKLSNASLSTSVNSLLEFQGTPLYAGAGLLPYYLRKNFAVGLLIADTKIDFLVAGKDLDSSVDLTAISDSGLVFGYAMSFLGDSLHLGINAKGLFRAGGTKVYPLIDIAQQETIKINPDELGGAGIGIDADLGAIYDIPGLPFGLANRASLTLNNLAGSEFRIARKGIGPPALTRMVSLGWHSVFAGWSFIDNFHVLFDLAEFNLGGEKDQDKGQRTGSFFKHVNLGVEMPIGRLALRTGLRQGYLTAGLGLNLTYLRLEFATYGEELSTGPGRLPSRRFALSLALGLGSPPAPVVGRVKEEPIQPEKKEDVQEIKERTDPASKQKLDPALELKPTEKTPQSSAPNSGTDAKKRSPKSEEMDANGNTDIPPGETVIETNP